MIYLWKFLCIVHIMDKSENIWWIRIYSWKPCKQHNLLCISCTWSQCTSLSFCKMATFKRECVWELFIIGINYFKMSTFCKISTTTGVCYDWTGRPMTYLFTIHKKATSSSVLHLDDNKIRGHTECTVRHQPNVLHPSPSRQTQSSVHIQY